ncbi:MAG: Protein kinase domain, Two component regulator propeller [Gemmatimonadetes bacterium]|nr:Protein kinase domain, Two component regulator propeller [Gemmatimonadota bacterium]
MIISPFTDSAAAKPGAPEHMHPVTLRFDGALETEFEREYSRQTIGVVRLGLVLAVLLYCIFGALDTWIAPAQRHSLWLIRYAVVAPVLLGCLALSTTRGFGRWRNGSMFVVALVVAFGIVAMTSIIPPPGSYLYYAGLLLVLMYIFGLTRLSLVHATVAALITIIAYAAVAIGVNPTAPALVVNNLFFLVSAMIIGFCSNYAIERYARTNFLQRRLIAVRTMELEEKNAQLVAKNRMLAESRAETVRSAQRSEAIFSALSDALPGTVLDDKYRVEEKIGSGNFGTVYRGEHIFLHHPVAIKVFRPTVGSSGADSLERFRLEGISACRINHPNAVTVLDFDISAGSLAYLVMELLHGQSLADELKTSGAVAPRRALHIAAAVCDVLAEAHAAGIVHRDVKPSNIFLHRGKGDELVKVIDFGIAKLSDDAVPAGESATATVAGMLVGTPVYMSPERLHGDAYDGRTDVYAVGVVLYEMLTGRVPFEIGEGGSYWRLAMMIATEEPAPPSAVNPAVPQWMDALVMEAMTKDPENRSSAMELARALRSAELTIGT